MLSRRTTLAALASSLVPLRLRADSALPSVIVIGAGMAGLSAARALQDAGAKVTVVEARDRIGGRTWTSQAWSDLPVDMGASWIQGLQDNPITQLADQAGVPWVRTTGDASLTLDASGNEVDLADADQMIEDLIDTARLAVDNFDADVSLADAVTAQPAWKNADATTRRLIRQFVVTEIEHEYAGPWTALSAWYFDEGKDLLGGDAIFPGGYGQLVQLLAQGLDIRTGLTVTALAPDSGGVRVTLADGSSLSADHVVLTVPLGVLRAGAIAFATPLAAARTDAINTLRMGLLNKCWLRFDQVAWPDDVDWISWIGPEDGQFAQWTSLAKPLGAPVLCAFHAADQALGREALTDAQMQSDAQAALRAMFGSAFPAPIASQTTRWASDPFALGSYSFNAVGTTPETRRALAGADWDGHLHFAGEATSSDFSATVQGAILSGRAAAKAILG
jgi:monoamine oxidase